MKDAVPTKIAYMGAGSGAFCRQVITDVLAVDGLDSGEFALVDIDGERLELARQLVEKLVERSGKDWKVASSTQRRDLLDGSDFVVNSIEVAGLHNVRHDYDIPMRYGVDQCIGDTIGPGGIFKALRTGPAWLEICEDIERQAPRAIVLNYTNPMSILTLAALRHTSLQVVGLCHSVQGTSWQLSQYLDVPYDELVWECAGINHNSWFTKLEHNGEDMYPRLRERVREKAIYEQDPVRFEVMLHLGYFVTESSGHFSEYVPYFRKRSELLEKYVRPGYLGESGFYANNWPRWRADQDEWVRAMLSGDREIPTRRSAEYASTIVQAAVLGKPRVIYGNVANAGGRGGSPPGGGLISNLPDGCVEVACLVDKRGIQPTAFGPLPEQVAALNRSHMAVHELVTQALLERDREKAKHALMLDPLTAAVCSLEEISSMFDEMWSAQQQFLTAFSAGGG
jgi:alpha-galactosidase